MRALNLINRAFLLKRTRLFSKLDLDLLLSISDKMETLSFREEDPIFLAGQEAHKIYFVVEGRVLIQGKNETLLAELGTGEFFGEEALFHGGPRGYAAFCACETTLLALSRPYLMTILNEYPQVTISLCEIYADQLIFRKR
jgi:CRP/FNR family transcriptional regulator, cyclic AMP receptor protein